MRRYYVMEQESSGWKWSGRSISSYRRKLFKILGGINVFPSLWILKIRRKYLALQKQYNQYLAQQIFEDIESPRYQKQWKGCSMIFNAFLTHDQQHCRLIIALATLINGLKTLHKETNNIRLVIPSADSAGYSIFRILQEAGCENIVVTESIGVIYMRTGFRISNRQLIL